MQVVIFHEKVIIERIAGKVYDPRLPRWHRTRLPCRRHGVNPWVRKISWRIKGQPPPVFLPGESHGQRSLGGLHSMGHMTEPSKVTITMIQMWFDIS